MPVVEMLITVVIPTGLLFAGIWIGSSEVVKLRALTGDNSLFTRILSCGRKVPPHP